MPSVDGGVSGDPAAEARQWVLRRNCCLTPRQMGAAFALLSVVSLGIAGAFAWLGYGTVLAFAGLEIAAVALALFIHCRHVGDREVIRLAGRRLSVERVSGSQVASTELPVDGLTVERPGGQDALITLRSQGRSLQVGRHLPAHRRPQVAQEIRSALAAARASHPSAFSV